MKTKAILILMIIIESGFAEQLAVTISPSVVENTVAPGYEYSKDIIITNIGKDVLLLTSMITDFKMDEKGSMHFKKGISDRSCAAWLSSLPKEIRLKQGESKKINLTYSVPQVEGGGYYAALLFPTVDQAKHNASGIKVSITPGIIISLTVNRGKRLDAEIQDLTVKNEKYTTTFSCTLHNTGNIHYRPNGSLVIYSFNNEIIDRLPLNKNSFVLPGSKRVFNFIWNNPQKRKINQIYRAECRLTVYGLGKTLRIERQFSTTGNVR